MPIEVSIDQLQRRLFCENDWHFNLLLPIIAGNERLKKKA